MYKISNITEYPLQKKTLSLPDGNQVEITLYFIDLQKCWVIKELVYNEIIIRNMTIVNNPNILREFKNILPFGLLVSCAEGRDPQFINDFSESACEMFILSKEEVESYEEFLSA